MKLLIRLVFLLFFVLSCSTKRKEPLLIQKVEPSTELIQNSKFAIDTIAEQSFEVFLEDFGNVKFASTIDNWVHFSLIEGSQTKKRRLLCA